MCEGCGVADHEHFRSTWNREIGLHDHATRMINRRTECRNDRRGSHAGGPQHRPGLETFVADGQSTGVDVRHHGVLADDDAKTPERTARRDA